MDPTARVIAVAGVVIALGSVGLNWFLFHLGGPRLKVRAFVRAESGAVHIEVAGAGRLTATVRELELRDHLVIPSSSTISRWSLPVLPNGQALPRDLAPSAFLVAEVDVKQVLAKAAGSQEVNVRAWCQRGDGKWYFSPVVRVR